VRWTDSMFRLGRGVKEMKSLPSPKGDWTDHAFRLGRMLRRGVKKSPTDLHEGRLASESSLINVFGGSRTEWPVATIGWIRDEGSAAIGHKLARQEVYPRRAKP
jgi:hypothetical protein